MEERSRKKLKTSAKPSKAPTDPRITDPRFANIQSDPRYRLPGKKNKVKLDKRFARVLEDEDFVKRAKVDRYGRPLESNVERKRLKRKYEFDEEGEDEESDVPDDDDEVQQELSRVEKKTRDPLREGRDTDSESSSDETTSDDESEEEEEEAALEEEVGIGPTQQTDIPTGEVTSRIAVVNLDWDNIRAADLMAVFSSFLSSSDSLLKVSIYPSEFGKERLEREEMEGPPKEIFANPAKEDADGDLSDDEEQADEDIKNSMLKPDEGTTDFDSTALRRYQLERLRYFYAILTFSSPGVAKQIYDAVDGTEYLRTANFFDLRFVPDDTDFSTDVPREECDRIPDDYRPNEFVTDALQHSKVKLTWDAEDGGRKEAAARAFKGGRKEIDENDLKAYLASDDSEEDEEEDVATNGPVSKKEAERQRMRALLGLPPEPEKKKSSKKDKGLVGDMQITFTSGLSGSTNEAGKKKSVFENSPEPEETTLEKYVRKERERKQKRKEKMKNAREGRDSEAKGNADDNDDGDEQAVRAGEEEDDLGFDDPFFAEPSAASEKAASKKLRKEERLKKQKEREAEEEADRKQRAELELLMADDDAAEADGPDGAKKKIRHFDMREIQKAEKEERKKNKKKLQAKKGRASHADNPDDARDEFKVDTSDPRFSRLFESHEYAIDPTNPKFKGTKAMRALLEERRRRKHNGVERSGGGSDRPRRGEDGDRGQPDVQTSMQNAAADGDKKKNKPGDGATSDVKRLVEKIKRRQHT
ncbi:hypothetical protein AYL99_01869 [Fonsecaea erecta]|uniref:Uncharacterized protein n=1 Tax=Fonsecaea erecta TaxID=1367422 RepID=A0A178ZSI3_9EURO|nr:hypothetical protein AYL99_01869 [Fonsecaea erecta]OAP62642.1 hypothetical protein AYL99_01869 [Fonsecaea erecta]